MYLKILLAAFLLTFSYPVLSQNDVEETGLTRETNQSKRKKEEKNHRGFLAISAGPSFAVGNFGKSDWNNQNSGFATNGYNFNAIDFGLKFVPAFGLVFSFKGANIPMDVQKIANQYSVDYGGEFVVESSRWNYGGIFAGPIVTIPTRLIEFDFRFQTGLTLTFSPEMDIRRGPEFARQESAVGPSFAFVLGGGARLHLSKKISFVTGFDYYTARPVFTVEYSDNNEIWTEDVYQNISVVNLNFGFALRMF